MSTPPPMDDRERADLVAYLDGELKGEAARSIETRLAQDGTARAEADSLKRAWDLLDYLPSPPPSPDFTHRTLEKLEPIRRTAEQKKAATGPQPGPRRRSWPRRLALAVAWAAAVVLVAFAGYYAYN